MNHLKFKYRIYSIVGSGL